MIAPALPATPAALVHQRSRWLAHSAIMLAALVAGAAAGAAFTWNDVGAIEEVTALQIFMHNGAIALAVVVLTRFVAVPVIAFNCFFLGLTLYGNVIVHGVDDTLALTAVHIPLELTAWLVTLRLAVIWTDWLNTLVRRRSWPGRAGSRSAAPIALSAVGLYALAALAEYIELALYLG